jgi:hypothetical protein
MIAELTLSALVGKWLCLAPEYAPAWYIYSFAPSGDMSITSLARYNPPRATVVHYTYSIEYGYLETHSPISMRTRTTISMHGRVLEMGGSSSLTTDGYWAANPDEFALKCTRTR